MNTDTEKHEPDALLEFFAWWMRNATPVPMCPADGVNWMDDFVTMVLFRENEFQVELTVCRPRQHDAVGIVEHAHPNVDTLLVHAGGHLKLYVNGALAEPVWEGQPVYRVRAGEKHSAWISEQGAAFLSVQRWLDGPARRIEHDWVGAELDEAHRTQLKLQVDLKVASA